MIWFLVILVLLFMWLLWLPIRVEIDTERQVYLLTWQSFFAVWVIPDAARWRWFFQVFYWQKEINIANKDSQKAQKPEKEQKVLSRRKAKFSIRQGLSLVRNLFGSIRLERLRINWDTDDAVLNAWLYPAFRMASRGQRQLFINFSGKQEFAMLLQTRLGLLAMAVLRVFLTVQK